MCWLAAIKRLQPRVIQAHGRLRNQVFQEIPVEGEFRKNEQVYGLRFRLRDHVQVLLDVPRDIAQVRVYLREADAKRLQGSLRSFVKQLVT